MNTFVQKFSGLVKGVLSGFDRIVFKGSVMPIMHDEGAMSFCRANGILFKEYKHWMQTQSAKVVEAAERFAQAQCGAGITYIPSSRTRKEDIARERQRQNGAESGLVGVWSAMETCYSFRARYCPGAGYPQLRSEWTKCKHLYFYFDHEDYGFMNIRLQTWFPYHIQIAMNGREWLRRGLERNGCGFEAKENKFLYIDDYTLAQRMLDRQPRSRFKQMLDRFLPSVFPAMGEILGPHLSYYWTLWQSEWATDLVFPSVRDLEPLTESLLRHAFMTGTGARILRYLDRPLTKANYPRANMNNEVASRYMDFTEGARVRHWVDGNSVKAYNERNVFRVETTINQPDMFTVHRRAQNEPVSASKRRMPLRKGVADIVPRTQISQEINNRFMEQLAACKHEKPMRELFDTVRRPKTKAGRRVRALDLTGKDCPLLQAISDPAFSVSGITNKALRQSLSGTPGYERRNEKQLRAKLSRQLRLLRDHGLIKKVPRQFKYQLTASGRELTSALNALLAASTQQLMDAAA